MNAGRPAWDWLRRELDRWAESGRSATFWWRDDDATAPCAELERLLQLSRSRDSALALAVIPALLSPELASHLESHPQVAVLQHGYAHRNHAAAGERKLEVGGSRDSAQILAELRSGFDIMHRHFGERFTPVLVPPWNRIDDSVVAELASIGFGGISTMRVRQKAEPAPGLLQVNAHLDPVNWRHRQGFIGVYPAVAILVQHLAARRSGYRDLAEPTGILSHHLVQNESVWRFLDRLLALLRGHPAVTWRDAPTIWKTAPARARPG
jgi:hypothetical protein